MCPLSIGAWRIRHDLKLDLLVEGAVVIEVKGVEQLHPVHLAQVITDPELSGHPAGLLMNFNVASLRMPEAVGSPEPLRERLVAGNAAVTT